MANNNGTAPAPLHPDVASKLLDLLSSDDDFRALFQKDAHAALLQAGYEDDGTDAPSGAQCMQLAPGATLASKEQIAADREKLQQSMVVPWSFTGADAIRAR